ncbi:zinc finger protein 62 homolog [Topomyia yanbarensis]|uniref:zinc finger protein 62 homolog n=1 Tax=Topomyia yanbarensis TaxID=2498891 RepID=UPI00273CD9CB|nr:zinc finger protein 62 homolog [Topomyia yanbarensis]
MDTGHRSRRSSRRMKEEPPIDIVDIKLEPLEIDDMNNYSSLAVGTSQEAKSTGTTKRKYMKSRATQVKPNYYGNDSLNVPSVSGENEPINPVCGEPIVPQCRFCLRRVSRANLKIILPKHKPKALAALKIKVFPGDAYPFACCNCLNLIEIILDFKNTVSKAKYLLLHERMYLESEGWDEADSIDAISKCRTVVEKHKNQIDLIHEENVKRKQSDLKYSVVDDFKQLDDSENLQHDEPGKSQHDDLEDHQHGIPIIKCVESLRVETVPDELIHQVSEEKDSIMHSSGDENEESDYEPSSDSQEDDVGKVLKKAEKPKQPRTNNKEKRSESAPRGELCDLCGQRVCAQAAESHKNRHLGIKPYKCPSEGCELTFYSRANQVSHVKRIHDENGVPIHKCDICGRYIRGALKVINYHKRKHEQKKEHVCQFCGKGFTMRQYLKQHVTVVHTEVFPHGCSYCGKKFKLKWSMLAHEKNVHEKKLSAATTQEQQSSNCELAQDRSNDYV